MFRQFETFHFFGANFFLSAKNGVKVRKDAFFQQSLEGVGEANLI